MHFLKFILKRKAWCFSHRQQMKKRQTKVLYEPMALLLDSLMLYLLYYVLQQCNVFWNCHDNERTQGFVFKEKQ